MRLTHHVADLIAVRLTRDGWHVTTADVCNVYRNGTLSTNKALASAILQEFDEYGVEP